MNGAYLTINRYIKLATQYLEVNAFVSEDEIDFIVSTFNLDNLTTEQMQRVRNVVVEICANARQKYRRGPYEDMMKYDVIDNAMSKIVAVIDEKMYLA